MSRIKDRAWVYRLWSMYPDPKLEILAWVNTGIVTAGVPKVNVEQAEIAYKHYLTAEHRRSEWKKVGPAWLEAVSKTKHKDKILKFKEDMHEGMPVSAVVYEENGVLLYWQTDEYYFEYKFLDNGDIEWFYRNFESNEAHAGPQYLKYDRNDYPKDDHLFWTINNKLCWVEMYGRDVPWAEAL